MPSKTVASRALLSLVALIATIITVCPWGVQIDNAIYDTLSSLKSNAKRTQQIVVVGIDEPSFREIGKQWPWPRELHGKLIDQLVAGGAKAVAFDLLFTEASNASSDLEFATAIKRASETTAIYIGTDFKAIENGQYTLKTAIEPITALTDANAIPAHVSIGVDSDGFVRRLQPKIEGTFALSWLPAQFVSLKHALPQQEFLINYAGGTKALRQASYYQALEADELLPKDFFRDKIVFIGVRSLTASLPDQQSTDHYPTPLTRWKSGYTAGVMIHAFAAASIIEGSWLTQFPRILVSVVGLLVALVYATFGVRDNLRTNALIGVGLASAITVSIVVILDWQRLYIPLLSATLPLVAVTGFAPYYNYWIERKKKQEIKKAFSSYVNKDIVRQIEEDPDALKLGGKQIEGTVLFMDIAGFSGLSETESPEVMIGFINDFLSAMIEIGMANGGTVERFLGDAIMLIWGAPTEEPDHARLACKTALAMSEKIEVVSQSAQEQYGFKVSARIGINSGSMTAGNIGGQERFCYTVLGDSVNLAARFEAANKNYGSTILIGESTKSITAASFYSRLIDITKVKGRESLQSIYELVGEAKEIEAQYLHCAEQYENALKALIAGDPRKADRLLNEDGALLPALAGSEQLNDRIKAALKELPSQTNSF